MTPSHKAAGASQPIVVNGGDAGCNRGFDAVAYREFIASKGVSAPSRGFDLRGSWPTLFEHQRRTLAFTCEKGRAAAFLDTGLGKSRVEAAAADEYRMATGKPSLILTPLAVARQMQRECEAVGVEARVIRDDSEVWSGVNIANYERLAKLDVSRFGGIVLDESSILKSFSGPTKTGLIRAFNATPYRLAATATPAPNDHMELGNHSEFLGYLGSMEMLCRWFVNDTSTASQDWRLKGHAVDDFWSWVASWARAAALPSDLGGDDNGFILPPLRYEVHTVAADITQDVEQGMLFRIPDQSATTLHREKRLTLADRVARAAEIANRDTGAVIVWCETNDESAALAKAIPDAIEVHGSMTMEQKEQALDDFTFGRRRVIVTKPKLAGFGLNWQHARTVIFASVSHSYEQHYQAVRRSWRYGQTEPVTAHVVISDTEAPIWANVQRKAADHDKMKRAMSRAMVAAQQSAQRKAYTRVAAVTLPKFMRG
jgi:superfamily II DNA or RNA helicase